MDERKILIVNLTRGLLGEDNAALLGALLVTKIQLASMSRADIPAEDRSPFYLYVDEFQHFATDSFATILSEARKYGLNLTVANQYIAQMSQEVKDAVFGNVGSMIAFRMGADDARTMQKYFEPRFEEYDLVHMHNRHIVLNMTIQGEKSPAFSAFTLDLPKEKFDETENIIHNSRQLYATPKSDVERYILDRYGLETTPLPVATAIPRAAPVQPKIAADPPKRTTPKPQITHSVSSVGRAAIKATSVVVKPKRRRRSRKKKTADGLRDNTEKVIFSKDS